MGGRAYLTRLALGRSAFEPLSTSGTLDQPSVATADQIGDEIEREAEHAGYSQQYDSKGNPRSLDATRRAEAQIAAKNEVLAAVGVCEKKNSKARETLGGKVIFSDEEWKLILEAENSIGETGRIMAECSRHGCSWWLIALRKRIQAGVISSNLSFVQILANEWHTITSAGFSGAFGLLMVGAVPELAGQSLAIILEYLIEEIHIRACELPYRLHLRRPGRQRLLRWIDCANMGALIIAQILLSPLAISAALQQLGLVSSIPASNLLPWNPLSPLRWAWAERADALPMDSAILSILFSPASLWSLSNTLYQTLALNYGQTPFCPERMICGPEDVSRKPDAHDKWPHKRTPWLLQPLCKIRDSVLFYLGWAPLSQKKSDEEAVDALESSSSSLSSSTIEGPKRTHRKTELSKFPSHFLALNIDSIFCQIIFLPLESLFLRSLVSSFVAGPLASKGLQYYAPGNGPLGALFNRSAGAGEWKSASNYMSKIGLCVGLQFGLDAAIWVGAYSWSRWMGVQRFHWGSV